MTKRKSLGGQARSGRIGSIALAALGFALLFGAAASAQWWPSNSQTSNAQNGWWSNQSYPVQQQQHPRAQRQPAQQAAVPQYYQYQQQNQYPAAAYQPYRPSNQPRAKSPAASPHSSPRRSPPVMAYAPPNERETGKRERDAKKRGAVTVPPEPEDSSAGGSETAYCVRLCDGRFFPLASEAKISPAKLCNALCPASKTKVFDGSSIDEAEASDGTRYEKLSTAHRYRTELVSDCTCNGKDPFGLAKIDPAKDPTLQSGDIVVTADGLQVFSESGRSRRHAAHFTPIRKSRLVSRDFRQSLQTLKIAKGAQDKPAARPEPED